MSELPESLSRAERIEALGEQWLGRVIDDAERSAALITGPQIEATKTLITLSSGAFLLSVSVAQFAKAAGHPLSNLRALGAACVCFAACTIFGVVRISSLSMVQSLRAEVQRRLGEIKAELLYIANSAADATDQERVAHVLRGYVNAAGQSSLGGSRIFFAFGIASGLTYVLGIVALMVFAISNL